jgi:hypothetical protein
MTHADEIRDLFSRYAAEVGRHLPYRGRQDIEREIEATLADRLDDRVAPSAATIINPRSTATIVNPRSTATTANPRSTATIEDAVELLRETGHPRKTAASYLSESHLIGPALYPLFLTICRIVLPVLAAVLIGALTLSAAIAADPAVTFIEQVLRILASTFTGVLQAFAVVVIVFGVLDRVNARRALASDLTGEGTWDPRKLPRAAPAGTIKVSDQIADIVGNTVLIAAVLFLPRIVVLGQGFVGRAAVLARLSDGFIRLLPVVVAVAALEILAAAFLLTRRAHTVATIAAHTAVKTLGIVAAGVYLTVWPFVLPAADAQAGMVLGVNIVNQVIRAGCILGIVIGSIEMAASLVRFARGGRGARGSAG